MKHSSKWSEYDCRRQKGKSRKNLDTLSMDLWEEHLELINISSLIRWNLIGVFASHHQYMGPSYRILIFFLFPLVPSALCFFSCADSSPHLHASPCHHSLPHQAKLPTFAWVGTWPVGAAGGRETLEGGEGQKGAATATKSKVCLSGTFANKVCSKQVWLWARLFSLGSVGRSSVNCPPHKAAWIYRLVMATAHHLYHHGCKGGPRRRPIVGAPRSHLWPL